MRTLGIVLLILCTITLATLLVVFRPEAVPPGARPLAGRWVTDHAATIEAMRTALHAERVAEGEVPSASEDALLAFADRYAGGLEMVIDLRIDGTASVAFGLGDPWLPARARWRLNDEGAVELFTDGDVRAVLRVAGPHLVFTGQAQAGKPGLVLSRGS
jgi:hypothetical protein